MIVSRRAKPGHEADTEKWLNKLRAAATRAPGHVGGDVQPPGPQHPGEWVIIYRFESSDTLQAWLSSPQRAALIDEGRSVIEGDSREQIVADVTDLEPVTAVVSFRVNDGHEQELRDHVTRLEDKIAAFSGFLRLQYHEPVPGLQDDAAVVLSFVTRADLDRWLDSEERRRFLDTTEQHLASRRTMNVVGGFGGWFDHPEAPPVRTWKQAVVVLVALFPTSLALGELRRAALPDLDTISATLFANVLGVAVLSWILMPRLTRWLSSWLRR